MTSVCSSDRMSARCLLTALIVTPTEARRWVVDRPASLTNEGDLSLDGLMLECSGAVFRFPAEKTIYTNRSCSQVSVTFTGRDVTAQSAAVADRRVTMKRGCSLMWWEGRVVVAA